MLYRFRKVSDDGLIWEFKREFPSEYLADRWASAKFLKWSRGEINFRVIFYPE